MRTPVTRGNGKNDPGSEPVAAPMNSSRRSFLKTASLAATASVLPLSLLEAMRNLDTPIDDGLSELAPELIAKRLGLSTTVASQIERYRDAADQGDRVPLDELVSVFKLVSRRSGATPRMAPATCACPSFIARRCRVRDRSTATRRAALRTGR